MTLNSHYRKQADNTVYAILLLTPITHNVGKNEKFQIQSSHIVFYLIFLYNIFFYTSFLLKEDYVSDSCQ